MFKRLLGTALVFGMAALAPPAAAQPVCGSRPAITNWLSANFNKARSAVGLIRSNRVVEVWVAEDTRTWTILITRADGISCIVSSGTNWTVFRSDLDLATR